MRRDIRFALRRLRRNPGFTAIAVLALAPGIGVDTTVFTFFRAVFLPLSLGAAAADVLGLMLAQGMRTVLLGILAGVAGAAAISRAFRLLLYSVSPFDPLAFIGVSAFLAAIALLAVRIPARRAMRVDSMHALRHE